MAKDTVNPRLRQIGVKIIQRREELSLSATGLAVAAGISPGTLSLIESGRRNAGVDVLCNIAEVLKVPLSCLQPDELDEYADVPADIWRVVCELKSLPQNARKMMIAMFEAQLKSLPASL